MDFFEMIKNTVLHILNSLKFSEVVVGNVISEDYEQLKVKIDDKIIIGEDEIVRTSNFSGIIKKGTRLLFIQESGGQRFFIIDSIIKDL